MLPSYLVPFVPTELEMSKVSDVYNISDSYLVHKMD